MPKQQRCKAKIADESFEAEVHLNIKDSVRTAKKTQHFTITKIN
jgi:hypothetical protein